MRVYSVGTAITLGAGDPPTVLRLTAPASAALYVLRATLTAGVFGAVLMETARSRALIQRASAQGLGGTLLTPARHSPGDAPALFLAAVPPFITQPAPAGDPHVDEAFRWRDGFLWMPSRDDGFWVAPSGIALIRVPDFPPIDPFIVRAVVAEVG